MTKQILSAKQREKIMQIRSELYNAEITFLFSETKEGDAYWEGVCEALKRIADSGAVFCRECGHRLP